MSVRFSSRLQSVELSMIRQVMMKARNCINLGIGEPDFFAPEVIREEAHRILKEEKIGYSPTAGIPELCQEILGYHGNLPNHSVCVTNGSQEALFDLILSLIQKGDEVLVPNPGFPAYSTVVKIAGGVPVDYPLRHENNFQLDEEELLSLVSSRTQCIILVSPSNPTGQCLTSAQMKFVSQLAEDKNLVVISDEIYREIHYTPEKPSSICQFTDRAVILSGMSKMASMTGWRLGWAYGPHDVIEKATIMHQYTSTCASALVQRAALKIFTKPGRESVEQQRKTLEENCDWICSWIDRELGQFYVRPQGAFYLMLSIHDLKRNSLSTSLELLKERVVTIPGAAFGSQGEGFLRLSFASCQDTLEEGLERLKKGFKRLSNAS